MKNEKFEKKKEEFENFLVETCVLGLMLGAYSLIHWGLKKAKKWEEKKKGKEDENKKHDSQD